VAIVATVAYFLFFRYHSERIAINGFFVAIEAKDFEKAYGIYNADPDWKQHPQKYDNYTFNQFYLDWGPQGDYGVITTHHIDCVVEPKKRGFQSPSGVVLVVRINNRGDRTESLWVEGKSKTISAPPDKYLCPGSPT